MLLQLALTFLATSVSAGAATIPQCGNNICVGSDYNFQIDNRVRYSRVEQILNDQQVRVLYQPDVATGEVVTVNKGDLVIDRQDDKCRNGWCQWDYFYSDALKEELQL